MSATCVTLKHDASWFSFWDACAVAARVATSGHPALVLLDLSQTIDTTTAALARLVLLRRDLLRSGSDLKIIGLLGRARDLYEVSRLAGALPRVKPPADTQERVA